MYCCTSDDLIRPRDFGNNGEPNSLIQSLGVSRATRPGPRLTKLRSDHLLGPRLSHLWVKLNRASIEATRIEQEDNWAMPKNSSQLEVKRCEQLAPGQNIDKKELRTLRDIDPSVTGTLSYTELLALNRHATIRFLPHAVSYATSLLLSVPTTSPGLIFNLTDVAWDAVTRSVQHLNGTFRTEGVSQG